MPDLPRLFGSRTLTGLVLVLGLIVLMSTAIFAVILLSGKGDQAIAWGERVLGAVSALGLGQFWRETKREASGE